MRVWCEIACIFFLYDKATLSILCLYVPNILCCIVSVYQKRVFSYVLSAAALAGARFSLPGSCLAPSAFFSVIEL